MASPADRWIDANGVCLRYRLTGAGPRTLVLVHEMAGMIESWDGLMPLLPADWRILAYDQRGFGLSEKGLPLTLPLLVKDLRALLEQLQIMQPVLLAGAALGAALCLQFTLSHPERAAGLVLSSPAAGGLPPQSLARLDEVARIVAQHGIRPIVDDMLATTYPTALSIDPAIREAHRLRWLATDPEAFIALNGLMKSLDLEPQLARIHCPTRIIGCTHDRIRPPARSAAVAAAIPGAQFVEAASGHYMPIQTPALFAEQLRLALAQ